MNGHVDDIQGKRFGMLTVMKYYGSKQKGGAYWICNCDCGKEIITSAHALKGGNTSSCGCKHIKQSSELCKTRNKIHGYSKEPLYFVWKTMRQRCYNPRQHDYKWYGAKGVKIAEVWNDYTVFRSWSLENGYAHGLTIDRIDGNKDYGPDNCRWITIQEQQKNKSNVKKTA